MSSSFNLDNILTFFSMTLLNTVPLISISDLGKTEIVVLSSRYEIFLNAQLRGIVHQLMLRMMEYILTIQ